MTITIPPRALLGTGVTVAGLLIIGLTFYLGSLLKQNPEDSHTKIVGRQDVVAAAGTYPEQIAAAASPSRSRRSTT